MLIFKPLIVGVFCLSGSVVGATTAPAAHVANADALLALDAPNWSSPTTHAAHLFGKSSHAPYRAFGDCFTSERRSNLGTLTYRF